MAIVKTLQFGIELEFVGINREKLAQAVQSVVGGTITNDCRNRTINDSRGRAWRVVPDASLSGGENSGEIVSPILNYNDIEELQNVVRAVRKAGGRSDFSTGLHVHVNAAAFDAKAITNLVKQIHKQERLLEHALGISESRLARYCRPIDPAFIERLEARRPKTMQDVSDTWYGYRNTNPQRYDSSRYHAINLNSVFVRGSIEYRCFNGTTHAGEVKSYVQLCLALTAKALSSKSASSKRREFNPATAKYDFRVVLLGLGLIGDEFKSARFHLTKRLAGSAAWKGERRDRRNQGASPPATPSNEGGNGQTAA
jgi:hypothetical protein